jgi:putative membrane protein
MQITKVIRDFLNGLAFGIIETVPGVSGGTIAIILGFYRELIEALNHFTENSKKYIKFLVPISLGIVTGLVIFSYIMTYLLLNFSFPTMTFFIGLIIGIIPLIYLKVKEPGCWFKPKELALILLSFFAVLIISNLKPLSITNPAEVINYIDAPFMFFIFLVGILSAIALVVPGISGSFVLLLLGIYHLVTYSVSSVGFLLTDITNIHLMLAVAKVLIPLALGIIIGGLSMARLIERLLKYHYKTLYSLILGFLLGSVYSLFKEPFIFQSGSSTLIIFAGAATCLLGVYFLLVWGKNGLVYFDLLSLKRLFIRYALLFLGAD